MTCLPSPQPDPIWDDVFHWCAWEAFIIEARAVGGWPDPEKTRQRCYEMYEAEKRLIDKRKEPR